MRALPFLLFVSFALGAPAKAQQSFDEPLACSTIKKPGLFYVRTQPSLSVTEVWPDNGGVFTYDRAARFVFTTPTEVSSRPPRYEGVWHVRTQTIAREAAKANKAHVYRAPARTRCGVMPDLPLEERLVSLGAYLDHHLSDPKRPRPRLPSLSRGLHLTIQDPTDGACVATDDRREFDVTNIYGFSDVKRTAVTTDFENYFSAAGTAVADDGRASYHSLSSQFAYRETPAGACISFEAPIPTGPVQSAGFWSSAYDDAFEAAARWKPSSTLIVLKRLEGRRTVNVISKSIRWAPQ